MKYYLTHGAPEHVLWYWQRISEYLWFQGHDVESIVCDQYALAAARQLTEVAPRAGQRFMATISAELAFAHMDVGELEVAEGYIQEARRLFEHLDDPGGVANSLRYEAQLRYRQRNFTATEELCGTALDILDQAQRQGYQEPTPVRTATPMSRADASMLPAMEGLRVKKSALHSLRGSVYIKQRRYLVARAELVSALIEVRHLRTPEARRYWSLAPLMNLGKLYERMHEFGVDGGKGSYVGKAKRCYRICIALTDDGMMPDFKAGALFRIARICADEGQLALARTYASASLALLEALHKYDQRAAVTAFLRQIEGPEVGG